MIAVECPKCAGAGHIDAFRGIANGVCFRCAGNKTVMVRKGAIKPIPPMTDYTRKMIETIQTADLSGLTYGQLMTLRDFAHWPCPHCPTILADWRGRGEEFFQAAQEERIANAEQNGW